MPQKCDKFKQKNRDIVINYKEISPEGDYFESFWQLYNLSFPPEERRERADFLRIMRGNAAFMALAAVDDKNFKGFVTFWRFPAFCYIEHLAVQPAERGAGIGGDLLEMVKARTGLPVVLEVETPVDELTRRRIGFYQRHGLRLSDVAYRQPPYDAGKPWVPMRLMATAAMTDEQLRLAAQVLHREVYGQA